MVRTDEYWRNQFKWTGFARSNSFLVARAGGKIVGYLRWQLLGEDCAQIRELCYDDPHADSALALYRQVQTLAPLVKTFEARLPFGHRLLQMAAKWNLQQSDFEHTMWKVLSPARLLERLRGTLSQRWREATDLSRQPHTLLVHCDGEDVQFVLRQDAVDVVQAERSLCYHREMFLNRGDLAVLLTQGIHEVQNSKLRDDEDFRALFPDQPSMLWQTDFF